MIDTYTSSLPAWGRGLKSKMEISCAGTTQSLPAWGRGLKYYASISKNTAKTVAPRMGAWIEIDTQYGKYAIENGRSPHGGVD